MNALRVSDHALVRFLERAGGIDVEAMRASLERSLAIAHAAATSMGGGDHLIVADKLVYVVREHTVVTVLPQGSRRAQAMMLPEPMARE